MGLLQIKCFIKLILTEFNLNLILSKVAIWHSLYLDPAMLDTIKTWNLSDEVDSTYKTKIQLDSVRF